MSSQQPLDAFGVADDDASSGFQRADGVYRWEAGGETCERCGADSNRLWRDGVREVCPDCKEW